MEPDSKSNFDNRYGENLAIWELEESVPALVYTSLYDAVKNNTVTDKAVIYAFGRTYEKYKDWKESVPTRLFTSVEIEDWKCDITVIACGLARLAVNNECVLKSDNLCINDNMCVSLREPCTNKYASARDLVVLLTSLLYETREDRNEYIDSPEEIPALIEMLRTKGVPHMLCNTMHDDSLTPLKLYEAALHTYIKHSD